MGTFLVALQFGLLFALAALATPNVLVGDIPKEAFMLAGACIALTIWIIFYKKPGNFNIRPPSQNSRCIGLNWPSSGGN
jgi:hypothetical protein